MILCTDSYKHTRIDQMKQEVSLFKRAPKLMIIVAKDYSQASSKYVGNKIRIASEIGIEVEEVELEWKDKDARHFELAVKSAIYNANENPEVDGIIVQLPLPYLNENEVASWISPGKDVDGFNPTNLGKVMRGEDDGFVSCTPKGILDFIKHQQIPLKGTSVCIVGRSNIVGKPLANLLINEGATVTVCNSNTKYLRHVTKNAEIVITAIGKPKFFTKDYFAHYQTVIDVGINFDENGKMCGDVDFDNVKDLVYDITPVPKGVGPLTVLSLMKNTIQAYRKNNLVK